MGAANVIPGVSGGTIAFITGIYQRLIDALKSFDANALKLLLNRDFKVFALKTDFIFLCAVFAGVGLSIVSLAKVLELAFVNYESLTLSFFFGLIIASIIGVGRQISKLTFSTFIALVVGISVAGGIALLPPAESNSSFIYLIACGAVAISSMILPGLSGSYVLLLMGNYLLVMKSISALDFHVLVPIAIGCVLGLVVFSRFLSYLFSHYKDLTISLLTGFVVGSLVIIWPWKETEFLTLEGGKQKAVGYSWLLPVMNSELFFALVLAVFGFMIVWLLERNSLQKSK